MTKLELLELISNGETSGVEFKLDDIRPEQLAKEVVVPALRAVGLPWRVEATEDYVKTIIETA